MNNNENSMKTFNNVFISVILLFGLACCSGNGPKNESAWVNQSRFQIECMDSTIFEFALRDNNSNEVIAFLEKSNPEGVIVIPEEVKYKGATYKITGIGEKAFIGEKVINVTIPNSVTSIGAAAFYGCNKLTSVTIPDGVDVIDFRSFYGCSELTSIIIPNSVTELKTDAFHGCSGLTSITIPNSVTKIENNAFNSCSGLTSINIPNSVTYIGDGAFSGCTGLTSITIPNSVENIGGGAFSYCTGLTSINIPDGVRDIYAKTFYACSELTSVTIPSSVRKINTGAFARCINLTSVIIQNPSIEFHYEEVFAGCEKLQPQNVVYQVDGETVSSYQGNVSPSSTSSNVAKIYSNAYDGYVNIRQAPQSKAPIVGILRNGPEGAILLGTEGEWKKIDCNGIVGYVYEKYVQDTPTEVFHGE